MFSDKIWNHVTPHINTGELRDAERVRELLSSPDIRVAYLLGDGHYWIDYALAQPNIELVVVRKWNPFNLPSGHEQDADGSMHQVRSAQEVFQNFNDSGHSKYKNNKRVRWIWGWNEPSHDRNIAGKNLYQLNRWMAEICHVFCSNGYGVALGGYAVAKTNGLPSKDMDSWDILLEAHAQWRELSNIDIHEYEFAVLFLNSVINIETPFPFLLLDRRIIDNKNWGKIPYTSNGIEKNWKMGNFANIILRSIERGYGDPIIGRGEWAFDTMTERWWWNDIIPMDQAYKDRLRYISEYIPQIKDIIEGRRAVMPFEQLWRELFGVVAKGVHTLKPYYAFLHNTSVSQWTNEKHNAFIIKQAEWFKKNSGPKCIYNTHYAWNTNPYWVTEDISHPDYMLYIDWMQNKQNTSVINNPPVDDESGDEMTYTGDMLDYLKGTGVAYNLHYEFPGYGFGDERVQTQLDSNETRRFYQVKGHPQADKANWEELFYDNEYIYRGTDTSPSDTELYQTMENGKYGTRWIKRNAKIGDKLLINTHITFRKKIDGSLVTPSNPSASNPYVFNHWIEYKKYHPEYTITQNGRKIKDVVELWGYYDNGGQVGVNFERYWYAKGLGLVAWSDPTKNWNSYMSTDPVQVAGATRHSYSWLSLPALPPLVTAPTYPTWELSDNRWKDAAISANGDYANVRKGWSTATEIVGRVYKNTPIKILEEEIKTETGFKWYPIRMGDSFGVSGWVREDVATYTVIVIEPPPPVNTDRVVSVSDIQAMIEELNQIKLNCEQLISKLTNIINDV